jgi:hypothetical protein
LVQLNLQTFFLRLIPGLCCGGGGACPGTAEMMEDIEVKIWGLTQNNEKKDDGHGDIAAAARVAHQSRQPAAQAGFCKL